MSLQAATAAGPVAGYVHAASGFDEELARLHLLQERYDGRTFDRLSALGPLAGAVFLEVGAGQARWPAGWPPRLGLPATSWPPTLILDSSPARGGRGRGPPP